MARLEAAAGFGSALARLCGKFRTAKIVSNLVFELKIEDLLVNISELATWPQQTDVVWDEKLANVVTNSIADSETVDARINSRESAVPAIEWDALFAPNRGWIADLTDFQRRDVTKLMALRHGANFSVPGAGKTRVALAVLHALRDQGTVEQVLIVGPKSSYESWLTENQMCFHEPRRMDVLNEAIHPLTRGLIVNYERLPTELPRLMRWIAERPTLVILDEAHRMKLGAEGAYGAACIALAPLAERRLILTGTPAPNGSKDLENLLGFVWPGHGRRAVSRAVAGGDLAQASAVLRPLFTRTTKSELGLPPMQVRQMSVDLPPLHREIYDALLGLYSERAASKADDFAVLGKITIYLLMAAVSPALLAAGTTRYEPLLYQVPPLAVPKRSPLYDLMRDLPAYEFSPKYGEAIAIVAANAAKGRKTLVWSTFVRSLTTLSRLLVEFSPAVVHGGSDDRQGAIERFRKDPNCHVLLANPATLGEGVSLHHDAHEAVYIDRDFAAGRFLQSLDRIHRLGLPSETETNVTILSSAGTIDEIVSQRLDLKLKFMGTILDDPAVRQLGDLDEMPAAGGLDYADLRLLLGHIDGNSK